MRLFSYEDLVNETGILLDQSQTDAQGNFILEGNVKQILPARIYVGLEYVDIILTPNASYDIEIIVPEKNWLPITSTPGHCAGISRQHSSTMRPISLGSIRHSSPSPTSRPKIGRNRSASVIVIM